MANLKSEEIRMYSFFIHPGNIRELKSDLWCDEPVPAQLRMGRTKMAVSIAYRGAHIRKYPKKSYMLVFERPSIFHGAREVHLNAEYSDPSLMRSRLSFNFFRQLGVMVPDTNYCFIKINGLPEGLYLQLESVDDLFFQNRGLTCTSIHYAIHDDANFSLMSPIQNDVKKSLDSGYELKYGDSHATNELCQFILQINTIPRSDFGGFIYEHANVDEYLRWLAGVVCTQNFDAFIQNYSLYRDGKSEKYGIIPWDFDATWGRDVHGELLAHDYVPIEGYNTLTARILDVPQFRSNYRTLMEKILETTFTPSYMDSQIRDLYRILRPYILQDPYLSKQLDKFDIEPDIILDFVQKRNLYLKSHLQDLLG